MNSLYVFFQTIININILYNVDYNPVIFIREELCIDLTETYPNEGLQTLLTRYGYSLWLLTRDSPNSNVAYFSGSFMR